MRYRQFLRIQTDTGPERCAAQEMVVECWRATRFAAGQAKVIQKSVPRVRLSYNDAFQCLLIDC